jgi:hypothetical protein
MRALGDLAKGGNFIAMLREQFPRGGPDALPFLQLVLFPEPRFGRHSLHGFQVAITRPSAISHDIGSAHKQSYSLTI